jgi:hypothetical protein
MYLHRTLDNTLLEWKNSEKRKPLLLRGARQVGKTDSVRNLGAKFEYFIELNFEIDDRAAPIFEGSLYPDELIEKIVTVYDIPVIEGKTLLFLDEIQVCIPAIQALRFFYEKKRGLHVIAAGSLLEFALQEIPSFGVGRIRSVFMHPMSFNEFLTALGRERILEMKRKAAPDSPLSDVIHKELISLVKKFLFLGGMPEVIANYITNKDITECRRVMDDLIISFRADFAKYKDKFPARILTEVFNSVVKQAGSKFVYSKVSDDKHDKIKEGLDLLILAGLVIPVTHTSANGLPLGAELNHKKRKMLLLDTGLFMRLLNLDLSEFIASEDMEVINRGSLAEMSFGLEMLKSLSPYETRDLYYWHRESASSNAEVDYVFSKNGKIIPVEVKAGTKGSMQSMQIFLREKNLSKGIRVSTENFASYDNIDVYPLYAVENILL